MARKSRNEGSKRKSSTGPDGGDRQKASGDNAPENKTLGENGQTPKSTNNKSTEKTAKVKKPHKLAGKETNSNKNNPNSSDKELQVTKSQSANHHQTPPPTLLINEPAPNKLKNAIIRSFWAVIMLSVFYQIIIAGPIPVIFLVYAIQSLVYREVMEIGIGPTKIRGLPWFRALHWFFMFVLNYLLLGQTLIHYSKQSFYSYPVVAFLAKYHLFICFGAYMAGFVGFVMGLKKGHYRFQFTHFCWMHMALLLVICQSHFIIMNTFECLIFFVMPAALVIVNDSSAYFSGLFWGKTPLISLSPKKTVEGFLGGFVFTMLFAFFFSRWILEAGGDAMVTSMRCAISGKVCAVNPVFLLQAYNIPAWILVISDAVRSYLASWDIEFPWDFSQSTVVNLYPIQMHSLALAAFASLIAPFGGFFASGVKRAFKIKDFSDSIPGHGGVTDRMDCQFIMGVFSWMYVTTFIVRTSQMSVEKVISIILRLSDGHMMEVYQKLGYYLSSKGLI